MDTIFDYIWAIIIISILLVVGVIIFPFVYIYGKIMLRKSEDHGNRE